LLLTVPKYTPEIQAAYDALKAAGQRMDLYRLSGGDYDPVNPSANARTVQQQTTSHGVVLPASNGTIEAFDNRALSDPNRRRKFRFVLLAGKGLVFAPESGDILKTAEGFYSVLGSTPLNPDGGGNILFNVGCSLDLPNFTPPA
jgi:hypothetical protein